MYQVVISRSAVKDLETLPTAQIPKLVQAIDALAINPRPSGCKKLKGGVEAYWRIRQGDYRIVYQILDAIRIVDIRRIRHRKEVYD